ncbi:hypothetical protein F5144DRAFT_577071 [Chaetomium tenue]|uniref:Uncharacterized protein n=1 Tax=Chaetomium tenue TaxID=1854479 RepID=A0ACB7P6B7_9PEZI|nr:hypothetical protein F5144DRAFT_577071 [Chaetomium globosum]
MPNLTEEVSASPCWLRWSILGCGIGSYWGVGLGVGVSWGNWVRSDELGGGLGVEVKCIYSLGLVSCPGLVGFRCGVSQMGSVSR